MNLDFLKLFPNQRTDNDPFECVGLTIADVLSNKLGQTFDPDFSYSLGFYINRQSPADAGIDAYAAMCAAVAYGLLPTSLETFTAKTTSELYVANFANFSKDQKLV